MQKLLNAPATSVIVESPASPKMAEKKVIKIKKIMKDGSAAKRYKQDA